MNLTSPNLELSEVSLAEIYQIGLLRMPNEACGLLLEKPFRKSNGTMTHIVEVPNRSLNPLDSFTMQAADLQMLMADQPDQDAAAWHTHPGGLVGPSRNDMIIRGHYDGIPMLVVALTKDGPVPSWF